MRLAAVTVAAVSGLLFHVLPAVRPEKFHSTDVVVQPEPANHAVAASALVQPVGGMTDEQIAVLFNTILSFGCSACILLATWPFRGLMMSWFFTKYRYTWPTHIMMTWFDVGCIGLFTTNLYALFTFQDAFDLYQPDAALQWVIWKSNFMVNFVMQGLWGLHNLHQWIIIMRGADKGTNGEWRRPYPMFLWSTLGACGTGTFRNLIHMWTGSVNPMVNWITGGYEILCLILILADLGYFLATDHTCGMNMQEGYGDDDK